jgi:hypothetical protein
LYFVLLSNPLQLPLALAPRICQLRLDFLLQLVNLLLPLRDFGLTLVSLNLMLSGQRIDLGLKVGDKGCTRVS